MGGMVLPQRMSIHPFGTLWGKASNTRDEYSGIGVAKRLGLLEYHMIGGVYRSAVLRTTGFHCVMWLASNPGGVASTKGRKNN